MVRSSGLLVTSALGMMMFATVAAQRDPIPEPLTPEDRRAIEQLSATYARALGLCRADEYAQVFTADGFYSSSEFTGAAHRQMYGPNGGKIVRAEMTRFVMSEPQCASADRPKTPREAPSTIAIVPSPAGAMATIPLPNGARYEDVYVKTPDGWRIKSREHVRAGQQAFSARPTKTSANPAPLTALDYIEIQQLVARYAWANDTCGNNGYDYADLYTPDGWFGSSRNGKLGSKSQGREKLAEAAGGGSRGCKKLERPEGLWIHDIVNLVIDPSPEGAVGKSRLVYPSLRGVSFDAEHAGHVGGYEYVFVRTAQGWRFRSVIHNMDGK